MQTVTELHEHDANILDHRKHHFAEAFDLGITAVELMPIHEKPLDGGYWGYNKTEERYEGVWIDTACTAIQFESGTKEGNVWTMTGQMKCPQSGADLAKKSVVTLVDNDNHKMEMYFTGPDGNSMKGMEINYSRV